METPGGRTEDCPLNLAASRRHHFKSCKPQLSSPQFLWSANPPALKPLKKRCTRMQLKSFLHRILPGCFPSAIPNVPPPGTDSLLDPFFASRPRVHICTSCLSSASFLLHSSSPRFHVLFSFLSIPMLSGSSCPFPKQLTLILLLGILVMLVHLNWIDRRMSCLKVYIQNLGD